MPGFLQWQSREHTTVATTCGIAPAPLPFPLCAFQRQDAQKTDHRQTGARRRISPAAAARSSEFQLEDGRFMSCFQVLDLFWILPFSTPQTRFFEKSPDRHTNRFVDPVSILKIVFLRVKYDAICI